MKKVTIKIGTDDFVDNRPTELRLESWQIRDLLKALVDHITHAASKEKPFVFRIPAKFEIEQITCPECHSPNIIPVLYGYMDGDEFEEHKKLLKLEQEGKIDLPGCDSTDGYNLTCKSCHHSWEWKFGYDWGTTIQQESKNTKFNKTV